MKKHRLGKKLTASGLALALAGSSAGTAPFAMKLIAETVAESQTEDMAAKAEAEAAEKARLEAEAAERARLEAEAAERARLEAEAAERARLEEEAAERARLEAEAAERARLEEEAAESARLEAEAAEKARLEEEAAERARLEAEAAERARLEAAEADIPEGGNSEEVTEGRTEASGSAATEDAATEHTSIAPDTEGTETVPEETDEEMTEESRKEDITEGNTEEAAEETTEDITEENTEEMTEEVTEEESETEEEERTVSFDLDEGVKVFVWVDEEDKEELIEKNIKDLHYQADTLEGNLVFRVEVEDGYVLDKVLFKEDRKVPDEIDQGKDVPHNKDEHDKEIEDEYKLEEITTDDVLVKVETKKIEVEIAYGAGEGGAVTMEKEYFFAADEEPVIQGAKAIPAEGYEFVNWTDELGREVTTDEEIVPDTSGMDPEEMPEILSEDVREGILTKGVKFTANFRLYPEKVFEPITMEDGTIIKLTAPEGALPSDTQVRLEIVDAQELLTQINAVTEGEVKAENLFAYKYTFLSMEAARRAKEGETAVDDVSEMVDITEDSGNDDEAAEVKPLKPVTVEVVKGNITVGNELSVYHMQDENSAAAKVESGETSEQ